jgi:Ca2+-binding EF-hand superfamily protein
MPVGYDDALFPCALHYRQVSRKFLHRIPPRLMSDTVRDIERTFAFFDLNDKQMIGADELRRILHAINVKKTNDECQDIVNNFDLNDDGRIDFHEFIFALARSIKHDVFTLNDIHQRFM